LVITNHNKSAHKNFVWQVGKLRGYIRRFTKSLVATAAEAKLALSETSFMFMSNTEISSRYLI